MALNIKKFGIPQEMVDTIKEGKHPLGADLRKAVKSSESDNDA